MVATNDDLLKELKNITSLLAGMYREKDVAADKITKSSDVLTELTK